MSKETDKLNARINELEIENKLMKDILAMRPPPLPPQYTTDLPGSNVSWNNLNRGLPDDMNGGVNHYNQHRYLGAAPKAGHVGINTDCTRYVNDMNNVSTNEKTAGQNLDDLGTKPVFVGGHHTPATRVYAEQVKHLATSASAKTWNLS